MALPIITQWVKIWGKFFILKKESKIQYYLKKLSIRIFFRIFRIMYLRIFLEFFRIFLEFFGIF